MKYRARANGNVVDEADVPESLIGVLFDPIEEERASEIYTPEAPLLTAASEVQGGNRRPRRSR